MSIINSNRNPDIDPIPTCLITTFVLREMSAKQNQYANK